MFLVLCLPFCSQCRHAMLFDGLVEFDLSLSFLLLNLLLPFFAQKVLQNLKEFGNKRERFFVDNMAIKCDGGQSLYPMSTLLNIAFRNFEAINQFSVTNNNKLRYAKFVIE